LTSFFLVQLAGCFKHVQCPATGCLERVSRLIERNTHVALRAKVVNFVRLQIQYQIGQALTVGQIAIVQEQAISGLMRIGVDVVDTSSRKRRSTTNKTVNRVALFQQQFGKVGTILTRDPGNESGFRHVDDFKYRGE